MQEDQFSHKIISWYQQNKRDLPWRKTTDPYKIWLSEIILQQTRVDQGLPYYERFIATFPNVAALAKASEKEVLREWQGLGYYSRARNLHLCAKILMDEHNGDFPNNYDNLLKLPGIGPYTAAAIASFCFKEQVAVVDGNVFRVLARRFGIDSDTNSPAGQKQFRQKANELIPADHPDQFNQAIMEFGALQCTPRKPDCPACPLAIECVARNEKSQEALPVKIKKIKIKKRYFQYLVYRHDEVIWMKERKEKDIWKGLYDFHLIEKSNDKIKGEIPQIASEAIGSQTIQVEISQQYKHILSHQHIYATFTTIYLNDGLNKEYCEKYGLHPYSLEEIIELPKPVLISGYLKEHIF